jgi:hypothetical protein
MARYIVWLLGGGFGVMFLYVGTTQWRQQRRALARAEPVEALIVESRVQVSTTRDTDRELTRSTSTTSHLPIVRFRYGVGAGTHESDRLRPTIIGTGHASYEAAAAEIAPFPVGATVRAWVNPAHPEAAFLVAERSNGPVVFIVLGLAMPLVAWGVGRIV